MQKIRYSKYSKLIFIVIDILTIAGIFCYFFIKNTPSLFSEIIWDQAVFSIVLLSSFWLLLSSRTNLYSVPRNITFTIYLERLFTHLFIFILGVILLAKVSNNDFLDRDQFLIIINLILQLLVLKSVLFFLVKYFRTLGLNFRNVMFLTDDDSTKILKNTIAKRKDYGIKICDYPVEEQYDYQKLVAFWKEKGIHTLFLSSAPSEVERLNEYEIYRLAEIHQVRICFIPNITLNNFYQYDLSYIETQPLLIPSRFPLDYFVNALMKRIFDLVFSSLILILVGSWLFPLLAVLIKLNSKGPVFFRQDRYGYHDQVFQCLKFRTMHHCADTSKTTVPHDERITKIGRFLRKSSLDEMPQFINVLRGDMSIVGPRPHMLLVDDFYKLKIGRYPVRSLVRPGITGLAQVNGLRGDGGNMEVKMKKRILADAFYVKNWSISLDLVIIFKTAFLIIGGDKNAY